MPEESIPCSGQEMLEWEKALSARVEALTLTDKRMAEELCTQLVTAEACWPDRSAAASAACARCVTRFLLHKKCKATLAETLTRNSTLRTAVFGRLNTYQYSLIFLIKRLLRLHDPALTAELLALVQENPYRDDTAKSYESRWSLACLIGEVLKAPEDYLQLDTESRALLEGAIPDIRC